MLGRYSRVTKMWGRGGLFVFGQFFGFQVGFVGDGCDDGRSKLWSAGWVGAWSAVIAVVRKSGTYLNQAQIVPDTRLTCPCGRLSHRMTMRFGAGTYATHSLSPHFAPAHPAPHTRTSQAAKMIHFRPVTKKLEEFRTREEKISTGKSSEPGAFLRRVFVCSRISHGGFFSYQHAFTASYNNTN